MDDAAGSDQDLPLVGRGAELDDLDDALASVSAGAGSIVLLEGEAGIGKSALVDAVRTSARLLGLEVRSAVARPAGARRFGLLAEAMLAGDRGPNRRGHDEPWLLVLEDLHEADDESLAVLYRLAHEGTVPHALVLATIRPVPRPADLAAVVAAWTRAGARYLELRPLSSDAALELAEAQLGASVGTSLRGSVLTAGGNPRFVTDVVRAVREAGALQLTGHGVVDAVGSRWLDRLDAVVRCRIAYLGPDVVHARGGRLVFRHELVRSALYSGLDPSLRRALHEDAARTLDAAGAPDVFVMSHRALAE